MENSLTKNKRAELGKELHRAKLDQDAITYDSLLGDQYRKLSTYKTPALQHLNDEIEKVNKRIAKLKKQFDAIREEARTKVKDLEHEYFISGMQNVLCYDSYYGMNVDGWNQKVNKFYLEHLYKNSLSGQIRLVMGGYSDTYVFEIRDNNLYIRKELDIY